MNASDELRHRAEVCDEMAQRLRRGQRADLPGSAHTVRLDAPSALAAVVGRFLAG